MSDITDPAALERLVERLNLLRADAQAKWGTLSAAEMLCHLADAAASVLQPATSAASVERHRFMKWVALRAPVDWPHGLPTPASVDPHEQGTPPGDFAADRERAIYGLRELASAPDGALLPAHEAFGPMSARDWYRWAYRHTDHHLKQFGL